MYAASNHQKHLNEMLPMSTITNGFMLFLIVKTSCLGLCLTNFSAVLKSEVYFFFESISLVLD